jgi:hypothetical protein
MHCTAEWMQPLQEGRGWMMHAKGNSSSMPAQALTCCAVLMLLSCQQARSVQVTIPLGKGAQQCIILKLEHACPCTRVSAKV